mmetsp:Transcript_7104/g.15396  ORF Transcript_7104/g.15396 Transcript_7104/m.15396 type:complete len:232 (+) Transcript_7104:1469-2164(+)
MYLYIFPITGVQGYYDPFCSLEFAPGDEGCYRCANSGNCTSPDMCDCAEGWTGYDCRTPVCTISANPLIRRQLMTNDEEKIKKYELDPCGSNNDHVRGYCVQPNACMCTCNGYYNITLCNERGGKYCHYPFYDKLHWFRDVLHPNEVFGTRNCWSGYEGAVRDDGLFMSCHLIIFEPNFWIQHTLKIIIWGSLLTIASVTLATKSIVKYRRRQKEIKISRRKKRHDPFKLE